MDPSDFLEISLPFQVAIGSGYAAYMIAYTGLRRNMTTLDRGFSTIAFSCVASTVYVGFSTVAGAAYSSTLAFLITVMSGLAWRKWGRPCLRRMLRVLDISWMDESSTALITIAEDTRHHVSQIAVLLDDDTWLSCNDTSQFVDAPHGPCLIGEDGGVGLYLTHEGDKALTTVRDQNYGDRITYIPAHRIKRLTIRHIKIRPSRP